MYKKTWKDLRKVENGFELEPEITEKSRCFSRVNFTHAAFNCSEEHFVATDTAGYLYYIDLSNDRPSYQKLGTIGQATFLAFNPMNRLEVLVGLTTADIKIVKVNGNLSQFCLLIAHKIPPTRVSFYNKYCLTCSRQEVIIWCLQSCSKVQQLRINTTSNIAIKKASFSNLGHIVVLYHNDNFQVWNFNQLEDDTKIDGKTFGIRSIRDFIFTRNGRAMIVAGAQNKLIVVNTCGWNLMRTVNLPDTFSGVKYMLFVPSALDGGANHIIACVSSSCNLQFFDLNQSCTINTLQPVKPIKKIVVSPSGRYLVYIEKEGNLRLITSEKIFPEKCESPSKKFKEPCRPTAHGAKDHLQCVRQCIKEELRRERMLLILKEFGEYPEKYRMLIWSTLLRLPGNRNAYNSLANKAANTNLGLDILKDYKLANRSQKSLLRATIHCLIQWCPLLIQCSFLPNLVFPFLIIFQKDLLLGFEAILSILLNYCQKWFEYHPLPPLNVLGIMENILLQADPELLNVFCERGITSSEYAWPLLNTAMSEVLSGSEWLILWDHLISFEKPLLFLMSVIAYSICSREIIISSLSTQENIKRYFTKQGHIGAREILKVAQCLDNDIPQRIHPSHYLRNKMITLPSKGPYPPFMLEDFPKFLTDETSPFELEKLKEQERSIREQNRKAVEIVEMQRLRHEARSFLHQIHRTRLNEARRCFKEQLSDATLRLRETEQRSEILRTGYENGSDELRDVPRLDLDSASEEDNGDSKKSRYYKQLQQDVDRLEYEVQSLLNSLRSQKTRNCV